MRVLNIARLTIRENVRSKLTLSLGVILATIVFGMPLLLKGDGSTVGVTRMTLLYTAGTAFAILAVATLWTSAASVSSDIAGKTMQLVRVKPVRMWQLWLGKWLGFLALNAALLFAVFVAIYTGITLRGGAASDDIAVTKRLVRPVLPSVESQINQSFASLSQGVKLSRDEARNIKAMLVAQVPYASVTLNRGESSTWKFHMSQPFRNGEKAWLRLRLDTDAFTRDDISAECILKRHDGNGQNSAKLYGFSSREMTVEIETDALTYANDVDLVIKHTGDVGSGAIMLQPRQGLYLMQTACPLPVNIIRAYIVMLSILAALAAFGLTLGALFTLPVAVFCATALLLTALISAYVTTDPDVLDTEDIAAMTTWTRISYFTGTFVTKSISTISAPVLKPTPLTCLAASEYIPSSEVVLAVFGNIFAIPLVLALLSSLAMCKKELPE